MAFSKIAGIRRHAAQAVFLDQALEFAAGKQVPTDVVQPHRLAEFLKIFQRVGGFGGFKNSSWLHDILPLFQCSSGSSRPLRLRKLISLSRWFACHRDNVLGGKSKLLLHILDRRGGPEACACRSILPAGPTYCCPAESRCLLDRHSGLHVRWQNLSFVGLALLFEDFPGRHADHSGLNSRGVQLLDRR